MKKIKITNTFLRNHVPNYALEHRDDFKRFWKTKLSQKELAEVRNTIERKEESHVPSSKIINSLQRKTGKLEEKWKAERAYYTESKRVESDDIVRTAASIGVKSYKIIPSPNACPTCLEFSQDGNRIFKENELMKDGRRIPPLHPSCYCILIINEL